MKRLAGGIIFLACLTSGASSAAPVVTGMVSARNGTPLPDVQVQVEIRTVKTSKATDAQGRFEFDAGTLFAASELRGASGLVLKLSKPGFQPVNKMLRLTEGQATARVVVQLDPTGGSAALDAVEKDILGKYAAAPGSTPLFLIPYSLSGIQAVDPKSVNDVLRANLERVIVTHLQASAVGGARAVSLKLLPITPVNDIDRLRVYGTYLNALGIITGYGAVEPSSGHPARLDVSSTFLVITQADPIMAPVLYVDDDVPADRVSSPHLYQHLSKLWGRSTVLALGVNEFGKAKTSGDKEALKRIRKYLQAERAGAGPGDEALVSQLNAVIEAADKELGR